jgi:Flavoprotein
MSEVTRMGERAPRGVLYVIVCAAPPAAHVQDLVKLAQADGWEVAVTATPEALAFVDAPLLEAITGFPVRHRWREPNEPESVPEASAIVVAPATFNTINRWAAGITNTVAVGTLCEFLGLDGPIVAVPNVNPPLARHPTFRAVSVSSASGACGCCSMSRLLGRLACLRGRRSSRRSTGRTRPLGGRPEGLRGQAPRRGPMERRRDPAGGVHVGR